jgi:hypothetical protein
MRPAKRVKLENKTLPKKVYCLSKSFCDKLGCNGECDSINLCHYQKA